MLLRKDDPWLTDLPVPDIRDWRVIDADGQTVGFVQSLAVDPIEKQVEAVLTGANDRYPFEEVDVEEHVVRLNRRMQRRPAGKPAEELEAFQTFDEAYRDHFRRSYERPDTEEPSYESFRPAYGFGRRISLDADYLRRRFSDAEEDVRAEYVARRLSPPYELACEAIRFGYELAQSLDRYRAGGMEREGEQIVGTRTPSGDDSLRTASSMDTGAPSEEDKSVLDES